MLLPSLTKNISLRSFSICKSVDFFLTLISGSQGTDQGTSGLSHRKDLNMPSQGVHLHIHDRYVMQLPQSIYNVSFYVMCFD